MAHQVRNGKKAGGQTIPEFRNIHDTKIYASKETSQTRFLHQHRHKLQQGTGDRKREKGYKVTEVQ